MDLDNILKNTFKEKENNFTFSDAATEKIWNRIDENTSDKRKWYSKIFFNLNKKRSLVVDLSAGLISILILIVVPVIILNCKPLTGKVAKTDHELIMEKAIKAVKDQAAMQFSKYSIEYVGEYSEFNQKTKTLNFQVYENNTKSIYPQNVLYYVDAMSGKIVNYQKPYAMFQVNYNEVSELIEKIKGLPKGEIKYNMVPGPDTFYDDKTNTNYSIDLNSGVISEYKNDKSAATVIYKYNPNEDSPLTIKKSVDIDQDGKIDSIKFDPLSNVLAINDVSMNVSYQANGSNEHLNIVDINKGDREKEIEVIGDNDIYSDENIKNYSYFCFKDGVIYFIGRSRGKSVNINGNDTIKVNRCVGEIFETWYYTAYFKLSNDALEPLNTKDFYRMPIGNELSEECGSDYQKVTVKQPISLYKEKGASEVAAILKTGDPAYIIGTDNKAWVLIQDKQGVKGWIEMANQWRIKNNYIGIRVDEVFDNIRYPDYLKSMNFK